MSNLSPTNLKMMKRRLKACPLCGTLNVRSTCECFICGWYGKFENDPKLIQAQLELVMDASPELFEILKKAPVQTSKSTQFSRLFKSLLSPIDRTV
ncbi:MAG: hypothetical protein J0L72_04110 [Armatimonadetes bacterium]|nr:hypothetical protein [Armatimonadota bacterium]